ncbi:pyridoxamine 5'-phosphate oxidase family protein [Nocardioides bruguierae]|uniref:Pyridoxamine 5'-phosphate oxidase family protein n=1 Tax=Nocardioides bruguierae TaxID=2945102 RepID=A0A9X2D534_9ACTN|nr:pyridoxamine 5'-phosphate oxidase family protein [Nocardioides bruguierae]MCL8026406.1 pyridoxamine 5'-phosphate oxidase family protein [Nocardioides bruguierae]MCM0619468.1 pyridoxamine 5'-phosphate oxidase family protein [Nocardioides bruguierae]
MGKHVLVEMDAEECWRLIEGTQVGRLAWNAPDGPTVLPVNIAVDGTSITFRTASTSSLTAQVDDSPVALEVDAIDEGYRTGWSVLVRGTASASFDAGAVTSAEPWLEGARPVTVTVRPRSITGRFLGVTDQPG